MRKPVIKVEGEKNQNSSVLLRQFSRKVSGSSILRSARALRYYERPQSELSTRMSALKRIGRRKEIQRLLKLGRPVPTKRTRR